jgi:hypothetical protein
MSPDGAAIAFGGPDDGLWVGAENAAMFEQRSKVGPSCLAWNADGLYACADQASDPFSIGVSHDMGATFDTLLRFENLCGATACPAGTQGAAQCAPAWDSIAPTLGAMCRIDAGPPAPPDAAILPDASTGGADAAQDAFDASDASGGNTSDASPPPPLEPSPPLPSSCACILSRPSAASPWKSWGLLALLGLARLRRWKRAQ